MIRIRNDSALTLISGVNVLEDESVNYAVAETLARVTKEIGVSFIFKASFDKANRSDHRSYRGPGLARGLTSLANIKREFSVAIITDVHETHQVEEVAEIADMIQVPAFLSRQTDLLKCVADSKRPVLLKKMQMMSPGCALQARNKLLGLGASEVAICERGTSFGYQNLVLDFQGVCEMKRNGAPVVVDVSHGLQKPGAMGTATGGRGVDLPAIARAATSLGVGGIFFECHPNPLEAQCDGPCALPLHEVERLVASLCQLDRIVKS